MKKIITEPLLQFILIGAILFLLYHLVNDKQSKTEIIIDNNLINEMASKWKVKRDREPTMLEIKGMVDEYITQEVFYREALTMNLDHNDEIIKRRLAKKMEFISDGLAESLQPSKAILKEYYNKNRDKYSKPILYDFKQIYFSTSSHKDAFADATNALTAKNPENLGDHLSMDTHYLNSNAFEISINFGKDFADSLANLPEREWAGPIKSGFGIHIIFINSKTQDGFYSFEEIAEKINVDYNFDASNKFKEELVVSLLENYDIKFELDDHQLKEELDEN